jgi:transposase-like protein
MKPPAWWRDGPTGLKRAQRNHQGLDNRLVERGTTVSYETIRHWCRKFGAEYARTLKRRQLIEA